jgi:hypothetical protein
LLLEEEQEAVLLGVAMVEESDQEITPATEEERELLSMTPSREPQSLKAQVVVEASVVVEAMEVEPLTILEETAVPEDRHTATTVALVVVEQEVRQMARKVVRLVGEREAQALTSAAPTDSFISTTMDRDDSPDLLALRCSV